jgi:hypothetical protein
MKELKKPANIYLKEYDVTLRPYLTLQEQQAITSLMMDSDDMFDRKIRLISGVIEFCTDITDDLDVDINDVIASGLWYEIEDKMYDYITDIKIAVEKYDSMSWVFSKLCDSLTENINKLAESLPTEDKFLEVAKTLMEKQSNDK